MRSLRPRSPHPRVWAGKASPGGGETGGAAVASLFAILAIALAALLAGCDLFAGRTGGGTETETAGVLRNLDGSVAARAGVRMRPVDYLQDSILDAKNSRLWDTVTDASGRFLIRGLEPGVYRLHADGGNGRGLVEDVYLEKPGQYKDLETRILRPHGSISGRIVLDSTAELQLHVQVFGMEERVMADPATGNFMVNGLPPGRYDLRFLGIGPYRRQHVLRGVEVRSGEVERLDPVFLDEVAKLTFAADSGVLAIDGLGPESPVIFDNEFWDNGPENEYVWAKASSGDLDLRGNLVTDAMYRSRTTVDAQVAQARKERNTALLAGLARIPEPLAGSRRPLALIDGPIEDIVSEASAGSDLIVAEARKCTPENPLVVVAGGPLTTVANAYLADNSIAPRMIVIAVYPFSINSADTVSTYVVAKRCRLVVWGRNYVWKGSLDPAQVAALPGSRMGERLKAFLMPHAVAGRTSLGDAAPAAYLFDRRAWRTAELKRFAPPLSVQPASVLAFDFLDIPVDGNDWAAYPREFFAGLGNAAAYHLPTLPGRLEAESYSARAGAAGALTAPGSAPDTAHGDAMSGAAGAWLDFRATSAAATASVIVRYRSAAGGRLLLGAAGQDPAAEAVLPPSADWAEAAADIVLPAGGVDLRALWSQGGFELDWIEFR